MRKTIAALATLAATVGLLIAGAAPAAAACTSVSTSKGTMTAAQVGGDVTDSLDATGCQIGVYYNDEEATVNAHVYNATYYGVFADKGASVDVTDSDISDIGDNPTFTGSQHGVAVYYTDGSSGTVSGNEISEYQKNGFAATLPGTNVAVNDNAVTGEDEIPYIAQNGIEFGFGAGGSASGNTIDGHWYTGASWSSTGLLLFDVSANQVKTSNNKFLNNQNNLAVITTQACPHQYGGVYEEYGICTFGP
jgi:hypothetical protein